MTLAKHMKAIKRLFLFIVIPSLMTFTIIFAWKYYGYEDIHGSNYMTFESFEESQKNESVVATYSSLNSNSELYLQFGVLHNRLSQEYSEKYYLNQINAHDSFKEIIHFKDSNGYELSTIYKGKIASWGGVNTIPDAIFGIDSFGKARQTFVLNYHYKENLKLGSRKSYLKKITMIMSE